MPTDNPLHTDIDSLLAQYLTGQLGQEDFAHLKEWCMLSTENRTYVRERLEVWFSTGVYMDHTAFDKEVAYRAFQLRTLTSSKLKKQERHFDWRIVYRVAVVVLILLLPLAYWKGRDEINLNSATLLKSKKLKY